MRKFITILLTFFLLLSCQEKEAIKKINEKINYKLKTKSTYTDLKGIEKDLGSINYDTITRNYYDLLSDKYYDLEKFEDYLRLSNHIYYHSKKIEDTIGIIEGLCKKGAYFSNTYKLDSMYFYYTKAEKYAIKTRSKHLLGTIYLNKAIINQNLNDYYNSEKISFEALKILKNKSDYYLLYNTYLNIGYATQNQDDTSEAIKNYNKALQVTDKISNKSVVLSLKAQVYYYFCLLEDKNKNYSSVYKYAKKGLALDDFRTNDVHIFCNLNNCLGYALFKLNNKNAISYFLETLKIAKENNNILAINTSNLYLSEYYLANQDYTQANYFAKQALEISTKNSLTTDRLNALLLLAKSNPNVAAQFFEKYKKVSDSTITIERQTREKFARIDYETNEIITEKENIQKEKENILQQLWSILVLGIFIILTLLLFYFIKSRNIKNKELRFIQEQQNSREEIYDLMLNQQKRIEEGKYQEKNRISQDLHDGVMGKLTAIRLNLFILKKKKDTETIEKCLPFIDDIQNIEKEIRQISHDLNQNVFVDNVTFVSIVESLFVMIKGHSDIDFKLTVDENIDWESIPNNSKINVYRIIQEALQNIDKYAKATKVQINMNKVEDKTQITITDNGIGFSVEQEKKGIGLRNMKKRMAEINGEFTITSTLQKGTTIQLLF